MNPFLELKQKLRFLLNKSAVKPTKIQISENLAARLTRMSARQWYNASFMEWDECVDLANNFRDLGYQALSALHLKIPSGFSLYPVSISIAEDPNALSVSILGSFVPRDQL